MIRRLFLFAGFNSCGIIDNYVVFYIKNLAMLGDVAYFGDFEENKEELKKITPFCIFAKCKRHERYDFGSWSEIFQHIGYEHICKTYNEIVLVNDSCFAPLFPLEPVFEKMEKKNLDAWSIAANHFLMSFFIVMKKNIFSSADFHHFITHISKEENKSIIIKKYERGLDEIIRKNTHNFGSYICTTDVKEFYFEHKKEIKKLLKKFYPLYMRIFIKLRPQKVRMYYDDALILLLMGCPLLKKLYFSAENVSSLKYTDILKEMSSYPPNLITDKISVENIGARDIFKNKFIKRITHFIFCKKYKHNKFYIYVFGIPLYHKTMDYKV